jgi:competence protein ComEA
MGAAEGPSPTRWAAAGFLGGASIVGMLWAILGRAPATPPVLEAGRVTLPAEPAVAGTTPVATPPAQASRATPAPAAAPAEGAVSAPEPSPVVDAERPAPTEEPEPRSPPVAEPSPPEPETPSQPAATERININTASAAELELLPRIGPTLAGRIIELRQRDGRIDSLTHLMDVKGIGSKTAERLAPYIRFE